MLKEMEGKERTSTEMVEQRICPVCGNNFGKQLPGAEDVVGEMLYLEKNVKIVDSVLTIQYEFHHFLEEDGIPLDESHPLIALIRTTFDSSGDCTSLELLKISAGR